MDYLDIVQRRYACRSYLPDRVEGEKLQQVLECGRLAPTAANRQEIKIIVIPTAGREKELLKIYPREWMVEAPYILAVCSIPAKCWTRGDSKCYSDVDAAIVMDHMITAATAFELGTCWVANFDPVAAREILQLDPSWEPVVLSPLGYPRHPAPTKTRKPLEEIVIYK